MTETWDTITASFTKQKGTNLVIPGFLQAAWTGRDNAILCELVKTQTGEVYKPLHSGKDRFHREKNTSWSTRSARYRLFTYACAPIRVEPVSRPALAVEGAVRVDTALLAATVHHRALVHV